MDAENNYNLPGVGDKEVKQYEGAITYTDNTTPEVPAEPEEFKNGAGTEEAPYLIENLNNFLYFAQNHEKGTYYKLEADIDLKGNGKNPWTPIGSGEKPFEGTFNGNGHTVSGLAVSDNTKDNQGLFGVNAGTIENLTVEGSVTGKDNVEESPEPTRQKASSGTASAMPKSAGKITLEESLERMKEA